MDRDFWRKMMLGVGLVVLVVAAYLPVWGNGFIWDDDVHVTGNMNLRSGEGLERIWLEPGSSPQYYPMAHTMFWGEYQMWGLWAAGYHGVNVGLHACNVILLWVLLRRLGVKGAWVVAAVFAVHPVEVETVAWVMEGKTLLSTLLYLLALGAFLKFWGVEGFGGGTGRWKWYGIGSVLFVGALLSKSVTATLPAVILLVLWWKRGRIGWRDVGMAGPLFVVGIASGIYTAVLERGHVGAEGAEWALTGVDRVLIAGRALCFYAGKVVWPHPLIFFYERWDVEAWVWWQYLFVAFDVGVMGVLYGQRKRIGRGALAAVLFFAGTLVPALGFLNFYPMRYSFVADHFQYLACAGLLVLGVGMVERVIGGKRNWEVIGAMGAAGVIAVFGMMTFLRTEAYRDRITLYEDIVAQNPESWGGQALLAAEYQRAGDYERAAGHWREAVRLKPTVLENKEGLGNTLLALGQVEEAKKMLEEVLAADGTRAKAYNDLAGVYVVMKEPERAIGLYEEAIARDQGLGEAYFNLGMVEARLGRFGEAEKAFAGALRARPEWAEAALFLGRSYASEGKLKEAVPYYRKALELRPGWEEAERDLEHIETVMGAGGK